MSLLNQPDMLRKIDLSLLQRHLEAVGWLRQSESPSLVRADSGRIFQIPHNLDTDLSLLSVSLIIEELMRQEGVLRLEDFLGRLGKKEDLLYIGCEFPSLAPGHLTTSAATPYYKNLVRLLRQFYYSSTPTARRGARGGNLFERITLGEPLKGSYMVAVHIPVDTIPDPVGRRVLQTASQSLQRFSRAVADRSIDPLVSERENEDSHWTASMCDAMYDLISETGATEVKAIPCPDPSWRARLVQREEIVIPVIDGITMPILTDASASLRGLKKEQWVEIEGIPYGIRDDAVIGEGEERAVDVKWEREDGSTIKVRALLGTKSYEIALSAVSKRRIRVKGLLIQRGTRWILQETTQLSLLDEVGQHDFSTENTPNLDYRED